MCHEPRLTVYELHLKRSVQMFLSHRSGHPANIFQSWSWSRSSDNHRHQALSHREEAFMQEHGILDITGKQGMRLPTRDRFSTSDRTSGDHRLPVANALATGKLYLMLFGRKLRHCLHEESQTMLRC